MPHHVGGTCPDGTHVLADYRLPIVHVMRRQLAALSEGRYPSPADAELIGQWAAANPGQVCDPERRPCTHPEAEGVPFRPPRYTGEGGPQSAGPR